MFFSTFGTSKPAFREAMPDAPVGHCRGAGRVAGRHHGGGGGHIPQHSMPSRGHVPAARGRGRSHEHMPRAMPVAAAAGDAYFDAPQLSHSPGGRGQVML